MAWPLCWQGIYRWYSAHGKGNTGNLDHEEEDNNQSGGDVYNRHQISITGTIRFDLNNGDPVRIRFIRWTLI